MQSSYCFVLTEKIKLYTGIQNLAEFEINKQRFECKKLVQKKHKKEKH